MAMICLAGCGKKDGSIPGRPDASGSDLVGRSDYTITGLLDDGPQLLITIADDYTTVDRNTALEQCFYFKGGKMYYVYPTDKNGLKVGVDGIWMGEPPTVGFFAKMSEKERLKYCEENKHLTDGGSRPYLVVDATLAGLKLPLPDNEYVTGRFTEASYSENAKDPLAKELEYTVENGKGFKRNNKYYIPLTMSEDSEKSKVNNAHLSWKMRVKFNIPVTNGVFTSFNAFYDLWCDGKSVIVREENSVGDYVPLAGAALPGASVEWVPVGNEILDDGNYTPFFVTDSTGNNVATESLEVSIKRVDAIDPAKEKIVNFIASREPEEVTIYSANLSVFHGSAMGRDCLLSFLTEDGIKVSLDKKGATGIEVE